MSAKPTGLAAFTGKKAAPPAETPAVSVAPSASKPAGGPRRRAQGETVALTVRVSRADWTRLHQLAMAEGISLQALALAGFSRVFAEHGLPPISNDDMAQ